MANTGMDRQAAKLLGIQKRYQRWIWLAVGMAIIVAAAVFYFMIQQGQAMSREGMTLDCPALVHRHTVDCFNKDQELICGYANYLVHEHNTDCYTKDGALRCPLPEVKEHTHSEACYEKSEAIVCGLEEFVGHIHDDSCYTSVLTCELPEEPSHTHEEACYDEEGQLICQLPETQGHQHTEECYETTLTCGLEPGEGGHLHTEECKEFQYVLTCVKPEIHLHSHTEACYEEVPLEVLLESGLTQEEITSLSQESEASLSEVPCGDAPESSEPETGAEAIPLPEKIKILTCGYLQTVEHIHGNECFRKRDPVSSSSELESGIFFEGSQPEGSSSLPEDASSLPEGMESSLPEGTSSLPEEPGETLPSQEEGNTLTALYEDAAIRVTASYAPEEGTPVTGKLTLTRLEEASELVQRQALLQKAVEDPDYSLRALLQVGFEGEEDQALPGPVELTVEFLGEGVSAQGSGLTAVTYRSMAAPNREEDDPLAETVAAPEQAEPVSLSLGEGGSAVLEAQADSLIGFGVKASSLPEVDEDPEEEQPENDREVQVSQAFSYQLGDMYQLIFHVEGQALLPEGPAQPLASPEAASSLPEKDTPESLPESAGESGAGEASLPSLSEPTVFLSEEVSSGPNSQAEPSSEASEASSQATAAPEKAARSSLRRGGSITSGATLPANTVFPLDRPVRFAVTQVEAEDPAYRPYADYMRVEDAKKTNSKTALGEEEPRPEAAEDFSPLEVLSYQLYYGGEELDLTGCQVTVDVIATEKLEAMAQEAAAPSGQQESGSLTVSLLAPAQEGLALEAEEEEPVYALYQDAETANAVLNTEAVPTTREVVAEGCAVEEDASVVLLESQDITAAGEPVFTGMMVKAAGRSGDGATSENTLGLASDKQLNPSFTVEYYSYLNVVNKTSNGILPVIDTRGGSLPVNNKLDTPTKNPILNLSLDGAGNVVSTPTQLKIYSSKECTYFEKPNLKYFDALINSRENVPDAPDDTSSTTTERTDSYVLKQVWVLKDGKSSSSDNPSDWDKYGTPYTYTENNTTHTISPDHTAVEDCNKNLHFTNRSQSAADSQNKEHQYIYIKDGAVIRLVYEPVNGEKAYPGSFFDYDISSGKNSAGAYRTNIDGTPQGINSPGNYEDSGKHYGFGNANTGTGINDERWWADGVNNAINMANRTGGWGTADQSYMRCTYGMVTGLDADGNPQFAEGIAAPKNLFGGSGTGSTAYDGSLTFSRHGDTYTLSSVAVGAGGASNLQSLNNPTAGDVTHTNIWTNNFWPMDQNPGTDGLTGGLGTTVKFSGKTSGDFAASDDGTAHNNYFGMHYSLGFNLAKEYVGPLEYLFFGDDDMWVFLTNNKTGETKLVCDIGGVHPSVGEYVNLWDYIGRGTESDGSVSEGTEDGDYSLDFFYTERGASGSTCWMQFTLPSVYGKNTNRVKEYGKLRIEKLIDHKLKSGDLAEVVQENPENDDEFIFTLRLTDKDGGQLWDDYKYTKYNADGQEVPVMFGDTELDTTLYNTTLFHGAEFTLKSGQYIEIEGLPIGAKYEVVEQKEIFDSLQAKTVTDPDGTQHTYYQITKKETDHDYEVNATVTEPGGNPVFTQEDRRVSGGEITATLVENNKEKVQTVKYVNTLYAFELPKTGGKGPWYLWPGVGLLGLAAVACFYHAFRKRKAA